MNIANIIIFSVVLISYAVSGIARGIGETEITTDDGIEVFQNEKYYLLKKNVKITSDDFEITSDRVKANFEIDLYDITSLETKGNSTLNAIKYGVTGEGDEININIKSDIVKPKFSISGKKSEIFITAKNGNFLSKEKILLEDNVKFKSKDFQY